MKHKYLLIPLLALSIALPAYAVETEKKDERGGIRAELKAGIEAKKMELNGLRKEAKEQVKEVQLNKGKTRVEALSKVYSAAILRLENIATRIESRIEKLNEEGKDTAIAEASVKAARTDIAEAKIHANAFVALNLTSSTTATSTISKARTEATAIKTELKSAHENLRKAVAAIKAIEVRKTTETR